MKPTDGEALAAETWPTRGIASPDRVPVRFERECNGGVEQALTDLAILLKQENKTKQPQNKGHV